jgi:hypothetical protein
MGTKIQFSSIGIIFSIAQEKRIIDKKPMKSLELSRFALFFAIMLSFPSHAQDTFINAAETLAYGVFTSSDRNTFTKAATDDAPPADTVENYRFREFTTQIPMALGTEFGLEYQINTKPKGRPISITTVIRFPEVGLKQPRGRKYRSSRESKRVSIGDPQLHGYGFDEAWELVPGEWVFEVWHKKAKLITKTFTVYDAKAGTEGE